MSVDDESRNQDLLEEETSDALAARRESVDLCWSLFFREMRKHAAADKAVLAIVDCYVHQHHRHCR